MQKWNLKKTCWATMVPFVYGSPLNILYTWMYGEFPNTDAGQ